jgi:hypothetical protein
MSNEYGRCLPILEDGLGFVVKVIDRQTEVTLSIFNLPITILATLELPMLSNGKMYIALSGRCMLFR